jgi:uncharacterized protein (TIGR02453 family)
MIAPQTGAFMFEHLIKDTQTFVRALARDNTRDWFQAHKAEYDTKLRDPAKTLLADMAPRLSQLTGYAVTTKLFRAHRDVRFSKDKTPYNTHLHMMWRIETGTRQDPAFFFGINEYEITVATGMMEFGKDVLGEWRKMAEMDGAYLAGRIEAAQKHGFTPWEPKLKRVPPPFDKDHPYGNLLRHKGLIVAGHPELTGDLLSELDSAFAKIWPVSDMLIGVAETPTI